MRRLRLGAGGSLYKKPGESTYTVDLSHLRTRHTCPRARTRTLVTTRGGAAGHKTSRIYGPTIHTLPALIQPWVEAYEQSIALDPTGPNPYLFSMASDWGRGHSSSAWTALVKSCFQRHAGVATPPKARRAHARVAVQRSPRVRLCVQLLRASFCTYLRSAEGVDTELLESCAKAMCARTPTRSFKKKACVPPTTLRVP